jgi:uncharacterized membrane protein
MLKRFLALIFILLTHVQLLQAQPETEMADMFRQDGKIYVVVAILSIVFAGIIFFLVRLERRIKNLEKNQD